MFALNDVVLRPLEFDDIHIGLRQDTYIFGMLKQEFYQEYETIFVIESSSYNWSGSIPNVRSFSASA